MRADYTFHAAQRRTAMRVDHAEVVAALTKPELSYAADERLPGGTVYVRGRIVVIVSADDRIVTLLWHRAVGRTDDGTPVEGAPRERRKPTGTAPHHRVYRRRAS